MGAPKALSVLEALKIDSSHVESLSEPDLCDLIGFIDDEGRRLPRWHADMSPPQAPSSGDPGKKSTSPK